MEPLLSTHAMPRHRMLLAGLIVAAVLVHALIFGGFGGAVPTRPAHAAAAVQVRVLDAPPEAVVAPPTPAVTPTPPVPRANRPARVLPVAAAPLPALTIDPVPTTAPAAPSTKTVTETDTTAIYPTELPPAFALRYVLTRGALRGQAELIWKPQAESYQLTLIGSVAGLMVLTQTSTGGFDAAGIAPVRFSDQRIRRGTKAANFQRDAGKISFSGPSTEYALRDGAQDRLSWMVQLGAIVAADAKLREPGARIALTVVGANGDVSVWAFEGSGPETVATAEGSVEALKFVREPREPYDTQVQVWLDPAHRHMPVRATQKSGPNDEGYELRLQSSGSAP